MQNEPQIALMIELVPIYIRVQSKGREGGKLDYAHSAYPSWRKVCEREKDEGP